MITMRQAVAVLLWSRGCTPVFGFAPPVLHDVTIVTVTIYY